jgi:hypothetical protein
MGMYVSAFNFLFNDAVSYVPLYILAPNEMGK